MRIEFRGYTADCTVSGQVQLTDTRLSDMLGRLDHVVVEDAVLHSLDGRQSVPSGIVALQRAELFAVDAGPETGDPQRRVRTVRHMLRLKAGPYLIYGEMHARPGADALRWFHNRRGMVPLTGCHVVIRSDTTVAVEEAAALVVNAELIESVSEATVGQLRQELVDLGATVAPTDPQIAADEVAHSA